MQAATVSTVSIIMCGLSDTQSEIKQCVLQVRLPTGTVIQIQGGWLYMNTAIYLSAADYGQIEGRDVNWGDSEG